jgi:hypothetical protein
MLAFAIIAVGPLSKIKLTAYLLSIYVASLCFVASLHRFNSALLGRCQKFNRLLVAQRSATILGKNQI